MSEMDQAFILAYATDDAQRVPTSAARTSRPAETPVSRVAPATMAAPHFGREAAPPDPYVAAAGQDAMWAPAPAAGEPLRERRPLSSFAPTKQPQRESFQPMLEVDAFRWPATVEDLLGAHRGLLMPVVEQLLSVSQEGRSMVGIAGAHSGAGCTTLLLSLARLLVEAGPAVAIVDGDFATAGLARQLGLTVTAGWENVLAGQLPLAECVVRSLEDRLALLPLVGREDLAGELLSGIQTSVSAGMLRYHYDLVLFDLGAAGQGPQTSIAQSIVEHCRLDAGIIVADTSADEEASIQSIDQLMSLFGSACLGLIGNESSGA